jgi:hypothetical protein
MLSVGRPRRVLSVGRDAFCIREVLAIAVIAKARSEENTVAMRFGAVRGI